jgi:ferrous iron transport protein A
MQLRINIMTLWDIPAKQTATIKSLCPELAQPVAARLEEMGFTPNQVATCIRKTPFSGPVVIQIGDCVYSIEQQLAQQIFIS